jgi:hypothetical protein
VFRPLAALLLCLAALFGCTQPQIPSPPQTQLSIHADEYSRLFEAAGLVLQDMGFSVPRRDYRFGQIATRPLNNPTVFEFWKPTHDRGLDMALQSTVNDQRRVARLFFEPESAATADAASMYTLRVEVMIERLQQPTRYMTHSVQQPAPLLRDIPAEVAAIGVHGPYWQAVTRDDALAAEILRRTVRRSLELARPDTPAPPLPVETF